MQAICSDSIMPYGAMPCRMVHLHAYPCFFMYMRWRIWMALFADSLHTISFFLSLWVTHGAVWPRRCTSFTLFLFSFQTSLPLRPQTLTLVTLIHNTIGKYALKSPLWSITEQWLHSTKLQPALHKKTWMAVFILEEILKMIYAK